MHAHREVMGDGRRSHTSTAAFLSEKEPVSLKGTAKVFGIAAISATLSFGRESPRA